MTTIDEPSARTWSKTTGRGEHMECTYTGDGRWTVTRDSESYTEGKILPAAAYGGKLPPAASHAIGQGKVLGLLSHEADELIALANALEGRDKVAEAERQRTLHALRDDLISAASTADKALRAAKRRAHETGEWSSIRDLTVDADRTRNALDAFDVQHPELRAVIDSMREQREDEALRRAGGS